MKKFFIAVGVFAVVLYAARWRIYGWARDLPHYTHGAGETKTERLAMKDGVHLRTDVFLPEGDGPFPSVLVRNPYDGRFFFGLICKTLVRYGYACVLQDARGLLDSEGEWEPFTHERDDGLTTIAWLERQPFCDKNIALLGPSYLGAVQWVMADVLPPSVKTIIPQVFGTDLYAGAYERGLFRHEIVTAWATLMPSRGMRFFNASDYVAATKHRPAIEVDELYMTRKLPWFRQWLENPNPGDTLWLEGDAARMKTIPERVKIPVMMVGGWFDPFLKAQLQSWSALATQKESAFIIGPYNHLGLVVVDGITDAGGALDQWPYVLDWLGHHLRGEPLLRVKKGVIRARGVGLSDWDFLGEQTGVQSLPFSSGATFTYDPQNPVPSVGGAGLAFAFYFREGVSPGTAQVKNTRKDVVSWESAPMPRGFAISGPSKLRLRVKSTADDTAFVARLLVDDMLVREGAATLALPFESTQLPIAYTPGAERDIEIDLWPMLWWVKTGAKIRVDLSSSSFPSLAIHSNFAGPWHLQKETRTAEQTIVSGELELHTGDPAWPNEKMPLTH